MNTQINNQAFDLDKGMKPTELPRRGPIPHILQYSNTH